MVLDLKSYPSPPLNPIDTALSPSFMCFLRSQRCSRTLLRSSEVRAAKALVGSNHEVPHGTVPLLAAQQRLTEPLQLSTAAAAAPTSARRRGRFVAGCKADRIREQAHGLAMQQDKGLRGS